MPLSRLAIAQSNTLEPSSPRGWGAQSQGEGRQLPRTVTILLPQWARLGLLGSTPLPSMHGTDPRVSLCPEFLTGEGITAKGPSAGFCSRTLLTRVRRR